MYLAPRKSAEATMARASWCGRTSGSRFNVTVTCPTRSSRTCPTRPFFTPDTRTGSPSFRPLMFLNTTSTGIAFETIERPVSQNMKPVNTTKPTSTRAPTVTSRLYVTSTRLLTFLRFGLDQRHLAIALQELQHRRELGRHSRREIHQPQAFRHPVVAILPVVIARLVGDAQPDVLGHAHRVEQRAVLEHVADLGAQLGQLLAPERRHVQPVHDHVARVGPQQAVDHLQGDALPHPGGAEQRHRLAVLHLERHAVQHHVLEEPLVDVEQLDHFATSRSFVMSASSIRIDTDADTTAVVVARPTPSAPCWVLKPR